MVTPLEKEGILLTSAVVSLKPSLPCVTSKEKNPPATRTYQTKTSFVGVHFDQTGKGRIVFLPEGAIFRVIGKSSCLWEGLEVMWETRTYNIFEIDLMVRSTEVHEPSRTKGRTKAANA